MSLYPTLDSSTFLYQQDKGDSHKCHHTYNPEGINESQHVCLALNHSVQHTQRLVHSHRSMDSRQNAAVSITRSTQIAPRIQIHSIAVFATTDIPERPLFVLSFY